MAIIPLSSCPKELIIYISLSFFSIASDLISLKTEGYLLKTLLIIIMKITSK